MKALSLLLPLALLTACGSKSEVDQKNASVADVAKAVAASSEATRFTPGRWETSVKVTGIEAPNLPPQAMDGIKQAMTKAHVIATCLTPEQAAHPEQNMFNRDVKNCRYDHFVMGGGKIDAALSCGAPGSPAANSVEMKGRFDATHYSMTMTTHAERGPTGAMTIDMAMESHLAGACRGNEMHGS